MGVAQVGPRPGHAHGCPLTRAVAVLLGEAAPRAQLVQHGASPGHSRHSCSAQAAPQAAENPAVPVGPSPLPATPISEHGPRSPPSRPPCPRDAATGDQYVQGVTRAF